MMFGIKPEEYWKNKNTFKDNQIKLFQSLNLTVQDE